MTGKKSQKTKKPFKSPVEKKKQLISLVFVFYCLAIIPFLNLNSLLDPAVHSKFTALANGLLIFLFIYVYFVFSAKLDIDFSIFRKRIFLFFLIFITFSGISVIAATNPSEAFFDLLKNGLFLILFSVFSLLFSNGTDFKENTTKIIIVFSSIIILIGLYQFLKVLGGSSTYNLAIRDVTAVFMNKNLYTQILFLTLPFNVIGLFSFDKKWRFLCSFNGVLILVLIILLLTRSVWAALFVSTLSILILLYIDQSSGNKLSLVSKQKLIRTATIVFAAIIVSGLLFLVIGGTNSKDDLLSKMKINKGSSQVRIAMWQNSFEMFSNNPLLGIGGGNWKIQIAEYGIYDDLKTPGKMQFQRPHNDYLWVLSENGIFGFLAYLGIAIMGIFYLIRIIKNTEDEKDRLYYYLILFGLIGYLVFSFFSYPKERISHNIYFYFILSIAVVEHHKMSTNKVRKVSSREFLIPAFLVTFILIGLIFVGIQKINSEKHTRLAIDASHQNNFKITSMEIDKAYSWFYTMDPTATPLLWYKGLANFRLGKTDEALINFNDGLQFNPSHSHSYNSLGIIYAIKSDFSKAKDYFITSLEIRPYSTESIINLAKIYIQEEDYKSAYAILLRVDLKEESNNYKSIMVLVLSNKIDSLSATMHDTLFIKYIAKVKESKPTVFELYKKSVEEGHSFEEQFFDYIAESIILNEKALSDDRKNQLKTYLIEN